MRAQFNDPQLPDEAAALLSFLQNPAGDPEAKNVALKTIISAIQSDSHRSQSLTTLMLLALWPGLDAVRSRLLPFCRDRGELDAELLGRLTIAVRDLDLSRVRRIAATLLRNLERDMRRDMQRRARETPLEHLGEDIEDISQMMFTPSAPAVGCFVDRQIERLSTLVGADARLVLLVIVAGYSQREAAALLGISHDAARKRYQRALERLRAGLSNVCPDRAS